MSACGTRATALESHCSNSTEGTSEGALIEGLVEVGREKGGRRFEKDLSLYFLS